MQVLRMLTSMAAPSLSMMAGDFVEVTDEIGKEWIARGIAEAPTKKEVSAAQDVIKFDATPQLAIPTRLADPVDLPDGKSVSAAEMVEGVCKAKGFDLADWNNLGDSARLVHVNDALAELKRAEAARQAAGDETETKAEIIEDPEPEPSGGTAEVPEPETAPA